MNTVIHGFDMEDTDYIHILHIVQCQKSYFFVFQASLRYLENYSYLSLPACCCLLLVSCSKFIKLGTHLIYQFSVQDKAKI